jgi:hypothetical protein
MSETSALSAIAFNCTLKPSPAESSCGLMLSHFADAFAALRVGCEIVRVADFDARRVVGFTIPASGAAYWVGEAMGSVDHKDFDTPPEKTAAAIERAVGQAMHLAGLLKTSPYPA